MVEPVHPLKVGDLDGLKAAPWTEAADDLGLEQPDHRLGERVVVAVADAAHRRRDPGVAEALGVANGQVLRAAVAVMDQSAAAGRSSGMDRCSK